jgi:hypothetical protein
MEDVVRNPMGVIRGAMNEAAGIGHNRTAEAVLVGEMPATANGSPRFASRMDGVEAGIVAGTMKIVCAR